MRSVTITMLLASLLIAASAWGQPPSIAREIAVQGDAWAMAAPDTVRITVEITAQGRKGDEVIAQLNQKHATLTKALQGAAQQVVVEFRGISLSSEAGPVITAAGLLRGTKFVAVESQNPLDAGKLIDIALGAGADSIRNVAFYVKRSTPALDRATTQATLAAKKRAELVAESLGLELGDPISLTALEEPHGAILLERRQAGEDHSGYNEREVRVIVEARFEAISPQNR